VIDKAGNLYGVTLLRLRHVYELSPSFDGSYRERMIHSFNLPDGSLPDATLVFDAAGNLYGTTMFGGGKNLCEPSGCGTVFRLERNSDKTWSETVLKALKKERRMVCDRYRRFRLTGKSLCSCRVWRRVGMGAQS